MRARLRSFLKETAGLIVLAAIVLLAALFFSTRSPLRPARVAETPVPAQPVPTPTDLTFMSPIVTPTPDATPTEVKPTPTPSPTPTPTPRPMPTVPGPLPPGLKIVYFETDITQSNSTLWIASVENLELRKKVCEINSHKKGYPPHGWVSPNGSKIAYLVTPPNMSLRSIAKFGPELWVIDTDGMHQRRLVEHVNGFVKWSPDSHSLIYERRVPLDKPEDAFRTDLYLIAADASEEKFLLSLDMVWVTPIGYSPNGKSFYYLAATPQGTQGVWAIDVTSREVRLKTVIDVESPWHVMAISPDNTRLLLSRIASREPMITYDLIVVSVDGREKTTILSGSEGDRPGNTPINRFYALWSPDGQQLLVHTPPRRGEASNFQIIDLRSQKEHTVLTNPAEGEAFFSFQGWSPDGKWLVLGKHPRIQSEVYLMPVTGGETRRIPAARPSHWVHSVDWITDAPAG